MAISSPLTAGVLVRTGFPGTVAISAYLKDGLRSCGPIWHASVLFCLLAAHRGFGQQPIITSVLNAASSVSVASTLGAAPQMLVSIKGQNLSTSAPTAATYPWPQQLAGSTVTFNGIAAALSYVSASQINAVVPSALRGPKSASVTVATSAGSSAPVVIPLIDFRSFGVFAQDMTGCGQAAAFNVHADGSVSMNTPQNSLDPLSDWGLTLFLTGLGAFPDRTDGAPWQFNPSDNVAPGAVNALFGIPGLGGYTSTLVTRYAAPAPGMAAVDQVNAEICPSPMCRGVTPVGCRVPLYLQQDFIASQIVNVSIHNGGGACDDSPANTLGTITWGQNLVSDVAGPSVSSSITAQFLQGRQLNFITGFAAGFGEGSVQAQPTFCAAAYPATLDAGTITISGGTTSLSVQPQSQDGILTYQASLPTAPGGTSSISASGATSGVGPFGATADIPPPIVITNNLQPGTHVSVPFTLNWTGGDDRSSVTVQVISTNDFPAPVNSPFLFATMLGGAGTVTVNYFTSPGIFLRRPAVSLDTASPLPNGEEIIVTQQPARSPSLLFTAPGLTLGGEQTWKYVWDFRGLLLQ